MPTFGQLLGLRHALRRRLVSALRIPRGFLLTATDSRLGNQPDILSQKKEMQMTRKPNYNFEKRQKEITMKVKQDEKKKRNKMTLTMLLRKLPKAKAKPA